MTLFSTISTNIFYKCSLAKKLTHSVIVYLKKLNTESKKKNCLRLAGTTCWSSWPTGSWWTRSPQPRRSWTRPCTRSASWLLGWGTDRGTRLSSSTIGCPGGGSTTSSSWSTREFPEGATGTTTGGSLSWCWRWIYWWRFRTSTRRVATSGCCKMNAVSSNFLFRL